MTLEELEELWQKMYEFYGDRLANPDHEPRRFEWQCKLYKYINNNDQKSTH